MTRVGEILSAHLVASVGWNHECLHKEVIEERGKRCAAIPGINNESLRVQLLLRREDVVGNLGGEGDALKVDELRSKVHFVVTFNNRIVAHDTLIREVAAFILARADQGLPVGDLATHCEGITAIEGI